MINMTKYGKYLFAAILLVAAILRFASMSSNPPSLNWDEVSHGYNSYSILKTGRDEWGEFMPTIFRAYGDYKLPAYIYLTVPSIAVFGLNEFSVRLVSAISGVITVIITYFLVLELFKTKKKQEKEKDHRFLAALASLLVAVSPWSLFISRAAFEANLAVMFITAGIYFFFRGYKNQHYYLLSITLLGLSVWTYNSARIFVPVFLAVLIFVFRKKMLLQFGKNKLNAILILLLATLFFAPMFAQLTKSAGQARYGEVAIIDEGAVGEIINARNTSQLPKSLANMAHNRPVYFINRFFVNWANHYSGNFLFFEGGDNYQFSIPGKGVLYPLNLAFLIIGVIYLVKRRNRAAFVILTWFYLSPIASSLTREAPHVLRSSVMLPTPMIISAFGLFVFINKVTVKMGKRKIMVRNMLSVLYIILIGLSLACYLKAYFGEYRNSYSWSWQYGYKEVSNYANKVYDDYDKIIVTKKYGEPHEFILFYNNWSPDNYVNNSNLVRFYQSNWYWIDGFDKYYFVNDWDIPTEEWQPFNVESGSVVDCTHLKCLLITSPGNSPKKWTKLETVNLLDGTPVFEIYEN